MNGIHCTEAAFPPGNVLDVKIPLAALQASTFPMGTGCISMTSAKAPRLSVGGTKHREVSGAGNRRAAIQLSPEQ
jgi:hypothetical protein